MLQRRHSTLLKAAATTTGDSSPSIPALVRGLQRTAAYLRHAPPSLYVTKDLPDGSGSSTGGHRQLTRHRTRVLDSAGTYASCGADAPRALQTHGVFVLTSTTEADVNFEKDSDLHSVLIGLPRVHSAEQAKAFLSTHADHLRHVRAVLLPEIAHSGAGHAVRALAAALPKATFVGSAFSRAYLCDPTFFDGVRRTVLANELVRAEAVPFAELPSEAFQLAEDGATVPAATAAAGSSSSSSARALTAYHVHDARRAERLKRARRAQPPHFHNQPVFYHDSAFDALFVGSAICRLPWLPHIVTETSRDLVLPSPPMLAAQRIAEGAAHPLLATWRPTESAEAFALAVKRVPMVLHLMSETYGEPTTTGPAGTAVAVANAADRLEAVRSRLSVRLETDTSRDVHKWRRSLLDTVLTQAMSSNTASHPTSSATRDAFLEWALEAGNPLGSLASALTQSAMSLPPTAATATTDASAADRSGGGDGRRRGKQGRRPGQPQGQQQHQQPDLTDHERAELEGPKGVALMQELLSRKGLGGLRGLVEKEEIDVVVFLAMSPDDFRRVLKATFGVSKKLELLQLELRETL